MVVILLNTLALAFYDYNDKDQNSSYNYIIDLANLVFTGVFISEGKSHMLPAI